METEEDDEAEEEKGGDAEQHEGGEEEEKEGTSGTTEAESDQPEDRKSVSEEPTESEFRGMQSRLKKLKLCVMAVGGQGSDASLLYIAWSKYREESLNFLRK